MFAESSIIPGTVSDFKRLGVDMEVLTILVVALSETLEEVADGHLGHLVLVKKFTLVSLLAQVSHPVFAYDGPLSPHVSEWAMAASRTHAIQVEFTQSSLVLYNHTTQLDNMASLS